jgi:enoyl-CoA hydratase/carnithine racemase
MQTQRTEDDKGGEGPALRRFLNRFTRQQKSDRGSEEVTEVRMERHPNGVLELRLMGEEKRNALGRHTIERIESLVSVPPIGTRVIVITAVGPDFCAGYDLLEASRGDAQGLIANGSNFKPLKSASMPIIAALHGNVIGGGLELALSADIRLATSDLKLSLPAGRLGLVYSQEGVELLVKEVGESYARSMLLAGRVLTADEAQAAGVITEIVLADRLRERALELGATIGSWSSVATSGNRRVVDAVVGRIDAETESLRLASFEPAGDLAASIERFASTRHEPIEHGPVKSPWSLSALRASASTTGRRLRNGASRAWWDLGTHTTNGLRRVRRSIRRDPSQRLLEGTDAQTPSVSRHLAGNPRH